MSEELAPTKKVIRKSRFDLLRDRPGREVEIPVSIIESKLGVYEFKFEYNEFCIQKMFKMDSRFYSDEQSTCGCPSGFKFYYTYFPSIVELCKDLGNSNFGFGNPYRDTNIFNDIVKDLKENGLPFLEKDSYAERKIYTHGELIILDLIGFKK
jgi:hypothetical protein